MSFFEDNEKKIPVGKVRTRFAPSPTGYMHIGNLRTALYTYFIARHADGTFILRIEDTDQGRKVEGSTDVIYRTLKQCHMEYDEGPDIGGPVAPYIQSERMSMYKEYADYLVEKGSAYRCFCEKTESEEDSGNFDRGDDPCRTLSKEESDRKAAEGLPYVIRQLIPHEGTTTFSDEIYGDITVENKTLDDQVLIKRDGLPTYNFANVVDDHVMGITHVVRGSEYLSSAPKYNLLYEAFGWTVPKYVHCPSVMVMAQKLDENKEPVFNPDGTPAMAPRKMSKRLGDPSFEDLLSEGFLTDAIINYVTLLGWSPKGEQEIFTMDELKEHFDLTGISKSPAIFDKEKLRYFNAEYIRAMSPEQFASAAEPYIRMSVKNEAINTSAVSALLHQRTEVLAEIPGKVDFFDSLPEYSSELFVHQKSKSDKSTSKAVLEKIMPLFEEISDWTPENILAAQEKLIEQTGCKKSVVMWPVRIAAAGKAVTPGGSTEICHILGKEETLRRLGIGLEKLS